MLWQIDTSARRPLHEQIAASVRRGLADGSLAAGEQLPPARELAVVLQVNANTVLAAYRRLRDEGLLEFRRGRGVRVAAAAAPVAEITEAVAHLVEIGARNGYGQAELARLVGEWEV
jgi:DNA-binding transcriptional regulator YhcF (GntR family)